MKHNYHILFILVTFLLTPTITRGQEKKYEILSGSITIGNNKIVTSKNKDVIGENEKIYPQKNQHITILDLNNCSTVFDLGYEELINSNTNTIKNYLDSQNSRIRSRAGRSTSNLDDYDFEFTDDRHVNNNFNESRIALVIGNSQYENYENIPYSINEVIKISSKLRELGFHTITVTDADSSLLKAALNDFNNKAKNYEVKLFYYSGHGQRDDWWDYLIPTDEKRDSLNREFQVNEIAYNMHGAASSNKQIELLFIDACRTKNELYIGTTPRANHKPAQGCIIIYSQQEGYKAVTDDNKTESTHLGPFANAFLNHIGDCDTELRDVYNKINEEVKKSTNRTQQLAISNIDPLGFKLNPIEKKANPNRWYLGLTGGYPNTNIFVGFSTTHNIILEGGVSYYYMLKPIDLTIDNTSKLYNVSGWRPFIKAGCHLYTNKYETFNMAALVEFAYVGIKGENVIKEATEDIGSRATSFTITPNLRAAWNLNKKFQIHFSLGYDIGKGDPNYDHLSEKCPSIINYTNGAKVNAGINYFFK